MEVKSHIYWGSYSGCCHSESKTEFPTELDESEFPMEDNRYGSLAMPLIPLWVYWCLPLSQSALRLSQGAG